MRKLLLLTLLITFLNSCNENGHKTTKIHEYHVRNPQGNDSDDMLFCYLILSANNGYYYYSSVAPVSKFAGVEWKIVEEMPEFLQGVMETDVREEPQEEVADLEPAESEIQSTNEGMEVDGDASDNGSDGGDGGGGDSGASAD